MAKDKEHNEEKETGEETSKKNYLFTEDQRNTLLDQFFQIRSTVKILKYACTTGCIEEEAEELPLPLDVMNIADALLEKLDRYGELLDKAKHCA